MDVLERVLVSTTTHRSLPPVKSERTKCSYRCNMWAKRKTQVCATTTVASLRSVEVITKSLDIFPIPISDDLPGFIGVVISVVAAFCSESVKFSV